MCDICADFSDLLNNFSDNDKIHKLDGSDLPLLKKREIDQVFTFIQTWIQRQCFCCFRDPKNYEKFHLITQSIILLVVKQLKAYRGKDVIESITSQNEELQKSVKEIKSEVKIIEVTEEKESDENETKKDENQDKTTSEARPVDEEEKKDVWTIQDMEKLLHFLSKVFLLNFPLYAAYKQSLQTKMEELTQQEATVLSNFCDVHDLEIPIHLLRNVCLFCRSGGVQAMTACFEYQTLPLPVAHAIISVVCNLKLWLNFRSIMQLFIPLRSKVLRYMCNMNDKDLRTPGIKAMADFMWSAVKDPMDSPVQFDRDGLNLAFKYFTSSTLTMRLAGISQINSHINMFNEMCNSENIMEVESVGQNLAAWLIDNNIISHIFGPNLHVEVIKQSHIILSFLAMECKITNEHIDIIWQAAQLKHCSKQVHDLLPPLIKNLEAGPVLHLYHLLCRLEPKDHTEQSLYLASAIIKFLWSSNGSYNGLGEPPGSFMCLTSYAKASQRQMSSSENSNSEGDTSEGHKSDSEGSDGPTPRKRPKQRKAAVEEDESSDADSVKIEDMEEEETSNAKEGEVKGPAPASRRTKRKPLAFSQTGNPNSKLARHNMRLNKADVGSASSQQERLKLHRQHKAIREKLKASEQQKDENSNSVKLEECSEEEEEEDEDEEDEESESEEEGVMLAGRISMDPETVMDQEVPNLMLRQGSDYIQLVSRTSPDCGQTAVMTELASLVQNAPHCRPFITSSFQPNAHEIMEEILSVEDGEGDGSLSSRMSNKSEKNMADFDGEESGCDEELAQFAARAQLQAHLTPQQFGQMARLHANKVALHHLAAIPSQFNLETVCKPGNTLLWDLLQDDKINQLGEGLAMEAEKVLCNLLCFSSDKVIRMKFIEGCLENLAKNWSVVVSLRLLPKLFASFQHFRGGAVDTQHVMLWALKEHAMMERFFENIRVCTASGPLPLTHVQVRLQFLTHIYSPLGLPEYIRLSVEELDTLWQWLANDPECSDELFSWLLRQTKSRDQHALRPDTLRHLYTRKLPTLAPETISMTALDLYQQLCNMARGSCDTPDMDHLWKIALRVNNTDVSMAAIQYLNNYYMSRQLEQESEFVSQCMANLTQASQDLHSHEEASLLCIQRALLLLNTHLDTFKRRYAYHLRRWTIEGHSLGSHVIGERERGTVLKVVIQPAGVQDKVCLEMLSSDYVAELRAEVTVWWESLSNKPVAAASDGPIRIITQGQELTTEFDEKTLGEIGFKDNQMVYISVGASRQKKRGDVTDTPSVLPPPPRESLPTVLLLLPNYFEQLFTLMQTLSTMKTQVKGGHHIPHTKAQVLSRRVWDILTLLPTSPTLLDGFQQLDSESKLQHLLDPASPQKLMYSLYIVESLNRNSSLHKKCINSEEESSSSSPWSEMFVQNGGLRHLFDIFMSGVLQVSGGSEWQQDCLACLLKLLCQLGMTQACDEASNYTNKNKRKRCAKSDKMVIPKLSQAMVQLMEIDTVIPRLTSILYEASMPRDPNHYKTGFWGRAQVVQYAMALIVSWAYTVPGVREALYAEDRFHTWLRRLVLEEPEPCVRREVCMALYRLAAPPHAPAMLTHLLALLDKAEVMRPAKQEGLHLQALPEDGKEPYGPACRDYFWLLSRLVDSLTPDDISKEVIDLERLASRVYQSIVGREYLETRHNTVEDDGLIGLLNLMCNILKHNPGFKTGKDGQDLLNEAFEFLFALPDPSNRHFPKCKSQTARSAAYDLLVELVKGARQNYRQLHEKLLNQHKPGPHSPYPWDYWPHEDGRSECGYVGLTNLGATCYMASCMQHLYMMPQARAEILQADCDKATPKHQQTLKELQRMFAYLLESERKAYNPRSFCKVYTMDHQPLNTGEQKDMAEFFIDLVSKLEEMTPELKKLVKTLFGGVISNNVVSLDCSHVSRTLEEFYTVRCQVADMRNLYESLDEVTVKDTLEGDNMYTCSQCGKKVRAEKRACFKKLPNILCFNTMRYTFNMVTMLKEKVNTHFSFPLRLDMSGYVEKHLMPQQYQEEKEQEKDQERGKGEEGEAGKEEDVSYEYDLIGVTVHTGTADGGHYYSFIRDRTRDKWFLFNDAEVKPFDPKQIAAECFGGEMTSKTYDSVTDKFMDLSFEKTNSAYMLFYERTPAGGCGEGGSKEEVAVTQSPTTSPPVTLSKELEDWIWQDNMHFLRDKNIFEHTYVQFMWQICGYVPQTLDNPQEMIEMAAQLSTTFFIETFIHAKEKPTMVQWVELLTKQFNTSQTACEWFLQHMAHNNWWPVQILVKCPNQMVRQMFQRLCQHVIQLLRPHHAPLFLKMDSDDEGLEDPDPDKIGYLSCVTMFIRMLLSLMEHGAKPHLKHLTEYFALLYEFAKMGEDESQFLISIHAISTMVNFYLGQKSHDYVEVVSEEEEEEEVVPLPTDKYKPQSLDKMIMLVALLVEKSRGSDHSLRLSPTDYNVIAGSKGFPFLFQQIKDCINLHQTRNLIFSLCRWNDRLASHIVAMIFSAIHKFSDICQPFYKLLTLLVEPAVVGPPGLPCFTELVLARVLEVMEVTPQSALDWLAMQVPRNKVAHAWVMNGLENWLQHYLLAHNNQRVRSAAAYLLVALVPSTQFRQCYRTARPHKEVLLPPEALTVLHQVYTVLLRLLMSVSVLAAAAYLLVALVPSTQFRQCYRTARPHKEVLLPPEALTVLHQVYTVLLRLLMSVSVLAAAAYLLVALVPSTQFRQCYRTARPHKEVLLPPEALTVLHQVYTVLLRLLMSVSVLAATAYLLVALVPSTQFRQCYRTACPHKEVLLPPEALTVLHQVYTVLLRLLMSVSVLAAAAYLLVALVPSTQFRQCYRTARPHKEVLLPPEALTVLHQDYTVLLRLLMSVSVLAAAAYLLVALVPSTQFRQCYRTARPHKEVLLPPEALTVLHQVYTVLLRLLMFVSVLAAAAYLLVALVPSTQFRQCYRTARPHKEVLLPPEALTVLHQVYTVLLRLLMSVSVLAAAAYLLVALVPSTQFRQCYRTARPHKEVLLPPEALTVLHQVYTVLLRLLKTARLYTDIAQHGSSKLSAYFTLLNYFAISRTEKLMFGPYLLDLWQLFHPKLSEPGIPVHHNKQALLMFWYHVCTDCPENVQLILQNAHIIKNIAFNYILADHEDQEVVLFNRAMLPAYYGLLRLCCQQSRTFTRQLATHQNLTWAFKNITPHPTQYAMAVDELFKLMALFAAKYPDSSEHEIMEINQFRKQTLQLYLQFLDGRSSWATLISAFRILVENDEDRHFVLYNGGLQMCFESFHTLHVMYHEATACHVTGDLLELLTILVDLVKCLRSCRESKDVRTIFLACKDWMDILRKLVTLLNTYNSQDMRNLCIDLLKELVLLLPTDVLGVLVPVLLHCHAAFQDNNNAMPMGPYFPRRGHKVPALGLKGAARPLRPMVQMAVPHNQIDVAKGVDPEYDQALHQFYAPYHNFVDVMCRLAINHNCMTENLVNLSAMVGFEAVPLHFTFFPKLWLDIYQAQNVDRKYITMLTNSNYFADYVESVLLDERLSLNINVIYDFLHTYFPKVAPQVLSDQTCQLMETLVSTLGKTVATADVASSAYKLHGDLRALSLVYSVQLPVVPPPDLPAILERLLARVREHTAASSPRSSPDESPSKKRKIKEGDEPEVPTEKKDKPEESSSSADTSGVKEGEGASVGGGGGGDEKAGCSKNSIVAEGGDDCGATSGSGGEVDWLERLQATTVSLIAALQQKIAHEEPT